MNAQSTNVSQDNFREISSWLMALRKKSGTTQKTAKKQQLILVVDNDPLRQFYTSIFLQRLNYNVLTAKTAEDALPLLVLSQPSVIVADADLPQKSGLDLLKGVKQDRRTRDIPFIIFAPDRADPGMEQSCKKAGAAAYLTRSAPLDKLYVAIQKAVELKPRRFVRLTTCLDVAIGAASENEGGRDSITALSEKGMFVNTSEQLAFGSAHLFTFTLPTAPGWVFRIEGQVIYNQFTEDNKKLPGIGVKFLKIDPEDRELIKDFIRETLMEGISIG